MRAGYHHFCGRKAVHIPFVDLGNQHAMRMRHIVMCGLPASTIFFPHYLTNGTIFEKKNIEHEICVLNLSTPFV
jgi:hypothetical protein